MGITSAGVVLGLAVLMFTWLAFLIWPSQEPAVLPHSHGPQTHEHLHYHDEHHPHTHEDWDVREPHIHPHSHDELPYSHPFVIDAHHAQWPTDPERGI